MINNRIKLVIDTKPLSADSLSSSYKPPYAVETDPCLVTVPGPVNDDRLSLYLERSTNPQNLLS